MTCSQNIFRLFCLITLLSTLLFTQGCDDGRGGKSDQDPQSDAGDSFLDPNDPTSTVSPPAPNATVVNKSQSARHRDVSLAFDDVGNGIAVWETGREQGLKLVYSLFDANSGYWSREKVIARSVNRNHFDTFGYSLTSNKTGFAVSWGQPDTDGVDHLYAAVYSNGSWLTTARLDSLQESVDTHHMVASDTGYLLVWEQGNRVFFSQYDGGNWSALSDVPTIPAHSRIDELASDGTSYLLAYFVGESYTVTFTNGVWSEPSHLTDAPYSDLTIVSNGDNYVAVWDNRASLVWSQYAGGSAWSNSEVLTSPADSATLASNGNNYTIAYADRSSSPSKIYITTLEADNWSTARLVAEAFSPNRLTLSSNGSDYGVSWLSGSPSSSNDLSAALVTADGPLPAIRLEESVEEVTYHASAGIENRFAYAWIQFDGASIEEVYIRSTGTSGLSAQSSLLQLEHDSPSGHPVIATSYTGQKVVVWQQDYFDPTAEVENKYVSGLFASIYDSGSWGSPHLLGKYGESPTVTSNGEGFLITYRSLKANPSGSYAVVFTNGAWKAPKWINNGALKQSVSTNGTGYALAWDAISSGDGGLYAQLYDQTSGWEASSTRFDFAPTTSYHIDFSSNGSGYALIWDETDSSGVNKTYASTYESETGWTTTLIEGEGHDIYHIELETNGSGYLLAWVDWITGELFARRYEKGAWQAQQLIDSGKQLSDLSIASNGVGYAALWKSSSTPYANVFDGTRWSGKATFELSIYSDRSELIGNNQGYLAHFCSFEAEDSHYTAIYDGTSWQQNPELVAKGSLEEIVGNGVTYAMVWQQRGDNGMEDAYYRVYDGSIWLTPALLENSDDEIPWTNINEVGIDLVINGTGYAAVWNQAHGGYEDPAVRKIWYREF